MSITSPNTETVTASKAVIYARVSSVAQLQKGHGLESQTTRCREFARHKGYEVLEVFQDKAVSGGMIDRPGMTAMLSYIKAKRSNTPVVVIIDDISRFARDLEAHLTLRREISDAGGVLESPSIEFGEDSDSILVENLLASVSQHQRQKNAEQMINRKRGRLLNGYWPFHAPIGLTFEKRQGRGNILVRDEPLASIIQEAIEGYACGRFQTQAEVARFLQSKPAFPKNRYGVVTNEAANRILTRLLYSGMIEGPEGWEVSLRQGQHEGLVSYETFLKVQERLSGKAKVPARTDLDEAFPLRGFVDCSDCGHPLTANFSKSKTGKLHPYYMCFKKGCESYRKSIRRDEIEGAFAFMLASMQPTKEAVTFARGMFRDIWTMFLAQGEAMRMQLQSQLKNTEAKIEQLLDRIVETDSTSVIAAYEKRITKLEKDKLLAAERLANSGQPKRSFGESFELALSFLENPQKLWASGRLELQHIVMKLAFLERPAYRRNEGFRTPQMALPFKALQEICACESQVAEREGFEPSVRKAHNGFRDRPVRPLRHLSVKAGS